MHHVSTRIASIRANCERAIVRRRGLRIPIVGITGTAGKTTTKEMLRRILSLSRRVVATPANRNANPALPILAAGPKTEAIVAEVGMNRPGMITWECRVIRPTIGVITNIGLAHAEACGGFAGVVRAKGELVRGIVPGGALVLNADDDGTRQLDLSGFRGRIVFFGRAEGADYRLLSSAAEGFGHSFRVAAEGAVRDFRLTAPGEHLIADALAAMAAARVVGAGWEDIGRGLASHVAVSGRQALYRGVHGSLVIDDSYNANPVSVAAGLDTLCGLAHGRPTLAVLGNMEEQGPNWPVVHRNVGHAVARAGVGRLVTVGGKAAGIAAGALAAGMRQHDVHVAKTAAGALRIVRRILEPGDVVLVKGSHSAGLSKVARGLSRGRIRAFIRGR